MNQAAQPIPVMPSTSVSNVLDQLERILLGKRVQLELAMACILARGHLLIEDVPGTGKTTLAQALGATLGMTCNRIQFTSDLLPADIIGVSVFNANTQQFDFREGPVFTSVLLADEINRAPPRAQSALLEAMEERQVSIDGETRALPEDFFVIATQNPSDQLGAYPLPESQLDRFLVGITIGYPDPETERKLLRNGDTRASISELGAVANQQLVSEWVTQASRIHVSDTVLDYVHALVTHTRTQGHGLSPRAGLNLVKLCRSLAMIAERDFVMPEDVQRGFIALAGHRLTARVSTGIDVSQAIIDAVPTP